MGRNDVSRALNGWKESLVGTRTSGDYVDGRWVTGSTDVLVFKGVVQNATPEDLVALPEGNRTDETIKIHTTFDLIPQGDGIKGDLITYGGYVWLVKSVAYRRIGNYNKVIAVKQ